MNYMYKLEMFASRQMPPEYRVILQMELGLFSGVRNSVISSDKCQILWTLLMDVNV